MDGNNITVRKGFKYILIGAKPCSNNRTTCVKFKCQTFDPQKNEYRYGGIFRAFVEGIFEIEEDRHREEKIFIKIIDIDGIIQHISSNRTFDTPVILGKFEIIGKGVGMAKNKHDFADDITGSIDYESIREEQIEEKEAAGKYDDLPTD